MTKQATNKKKAKQYQKDLKMVIESLEEDIDKFMSAANRLVTNSSCRF